MKRLACKHDPSHAEARGAGLGGVAVLVASRREHVGPVGVSGSTVIAAEQARRRAFVMELDGLYCDVIVRRWEQYTGKQGRRQSFCRFPEQGGWERGRRGGRSQVESGWERWRSIPDFAAGRR